MGYNLHQDTDLLEMKVDLAVIANYKCNKHLLKICTHRPSLSLKNEISRNKVDATEAVSRDIAYI